MIGDLIELFFGIFDFISTRRPNHTELYGFNLLKPIDDSKEVIAEAEYFNPFTYPIEIIFADGSCKKMDDKTYELTIESNFDFPPKHYFSTKHLKHTSTKLYKSIIVESETVALFKINLPDYSSDEVLFHFAYKPSGHKKHFKVSTFDT